MELNQFKSIDGLSNYSFSNDGQAWSKFYKKLLIPQYEKKNGYYYYTLVNDEGKKKNIRIHRLVATAFVPNPDNLDTVNHIDGCKGNNHYSNLEWLSLEDNMKHAHKTGLCDNRGANNVNTKLNESVVLEIRRLYSTGEYSHRKLGKQFGIEKSTIRQIVNRITWKHI